LSLSGEDLLNNASKPFKKILPADQLRKWQNSVDQCGHQFHCLFKMIPFNDELFNKFANDL